MERVREREKGDIQNQLMAELKGKIESIVTSYTTYFFPRFDGYHMYSLWTEKKFVRQNSRSVHTYIHTFSPRTKSLLLWLTTEL